MNDWAKKARKYNPPLEEVYSKTGDPKEEKAARLAMDYFVTDPQGAIYAIRSLVPEIFSALLKARYSRTQLSAKQLLWREFVASKENIPWNKIKKGLEALDTVFNFKKAEDVAERILLQFGDDSVFELGGAHLFLDRVSMVASKIIEDVRIGMSPLEKSTRYVVFDQKGSDGDYSFFKDPKLMESKYKDQYLEVTRACFELYAKSVAILMKYYEDQIPIQSQEFPDLSNEQALGFANEQALGFANKYQMTPFKNLKDEKSIKSAQIAYQASVRSKVCDIARVLLPASTLTNIGEFGNARGFGYLILKSKVSPLSEVQMIGEEAMRELKKVLPKFFDGVDSEFGLIHQEFMCNTEECLKKRAKKLLQGIVPQKAERVELVRLDKNPEITIAAALLYPYSSLPLKQLIALVKKMGPTAVSDILHDSLKFRTNRRHKPPRAFELPGYDLVFDIVGNFGIYRDLHRQRILTQQRQKYTTDLGFDMPSEFKEIGLDQNFVELMSKMKKVHSLVDKQFPDESQYLTTMANYTRWYMGMNLREAFWLTELRSVPQGHFSYRTIAQDMFIKACEVYPFLKDLKPKREQFVDMADRSKNLERMEAMQQIQIRLAQVEEKYS